MSSKKTYLVLVLFALFSRSLMADTFGFKPDGSNYFKTVSESTDGTIQISVTDEGSAGFSLNFQLHVDNNHSQNYCPSNLLYLRL